MKTENKYIKVFILDILLYTDDVDGDGKRLPRRVFHKDHYVGLNRAKQKIIDSMEVFFDKVLFDRIRDYNIKIATNAKDAPLSEEMLKEKREIEEKTAEKKIQWLKSKGVSEEDRKFVIFERQTNEPLEFTDKEKKAIKFYFESREDITDIGADNFEEFEKIIQ